MRMSKKRLGQWGWCILMTTLCLSCHSPAGTSSVVDEQSSMSTSVRGGDEYVALGSSFAAGPGIPPAQPNTPSACGRSSTNYASMVARQWNLTLTDASCSGATTANILTKSQAGQPPQIAAVTAATKLVTITIGGNDVNYIGSLLAYACQNTGIRQSCDIVDRDAIERSLAVVDDKVGDVITAVRAKAPKARVFMVSYLTVLPSASPACAGVPLTDDQLAFERTVARRLLEATRQAAAATQATLIDAASASAHHDACATNPWTEKNTVAAGRVSYHPNTAGMTAIAELITRRH
jgi:lysophospholipase L1-like esterase